MTSRNNNGKVGGSGRRRKRQAAESDFVGEFPTTLGAGDDEDFVRGNDEEFSEAAMRKLQRQINSEDQEQVNEPYHMWSAKAKKANEAFISFVATQVQRRAVVPDDPKVHERFRRAEAAAGGEQGPASISIFDVRKPDPDYATKMRGVGERAPKRASDPLSHRHTKEATLIVELRNANGFDARQPLPAGVAESERFCDACIPELCERAFHCLDTYDQAVRAAARLTQARATPTTLAGFIKTLRAECAMPVFCVRFLHDATLEVCLHMESNASYFAVFALSIAKQVAFMAASENKSTDQMLKLLRSRVCLQIAEEREKSEKRLHTAAMLLQAPLTSLTAAQITEREKYVQDEREFRALADHFHVRFEDADANQLEYRDIAVHSPFAAFSIDKSPLLSSLECSYLYMYFATCQCLMQDTDTEETTAATSTADDRALVASIGYDFNAKLDKSKEKPK